MSAFKKKCVHRKNIYSAPYLLVNLKGLQCSRVPWNINLLFIIFRASHESFPYVSRHCCSPRERTWYKQVVTLGGWLCPPQAVLAQEACGWQDREGL